MLLDYISKEQEYLHHILAGHAPSNSSRVCQICRTGRTADWRCRDCSSADDLCDVCVVERHSFNLCHRVQRWGGTYFQDSFLAQAGLCLHLGNQGRPCVCRPGDWSAETLASAAQINAPALTDPNFNQAFEINGYHLPILTIVSRTGLHRLPVAWCTCPSAQSKDLQLLSLCLFPGSQRDPRTAYTFNLLDYLVLDNLETKTSARAFAAKVQRLTSPYFPNIGKVRSSVGLSELADYGNLP